MTHTFILHSTLYSKRANCTLVRAEVINGQHTEKARKVENTPQDFDQFTINRLKAIRARKSVYDDFCAKCMRIRPHRLRDKSCKVCLLTPRMTARSNGSPHYKAWCERHGDVYFSTRFGKCLKCYNAAGILRPEKRHKNARSIARIEGSATYDAVCYLHGETPFSTRHGKCLLCFTRTGTVRKPEKIIGLRAFARRLGLSSYLGTCDQHGETEFSVLFGKCLTCYTAGGMIRKVTLIRVEHPHKPD